MPALRRFASALAVVLAAVVAVQTLDVLPCADEAGAAGHAETSHTDDGGTAPDCLCHVVFTRTEALPAVAAAPALPPPAYAPFAERPSSAEGSGVDHVPLG